MLFVVSFSLECPPTLFRFSPGHHYAFPQLMPSTRLLGLLLLLHLPELSLLV